MTRETKVGLGVATTFLCLVSLTVASKLRGPEASAAVAGVRPAEPGAGDPKNDGFEPSESHGDKPPNRQPGNPRQPTPNTLPTVPPSLNINNKAPAEALHAALPQGLPPSAGSQALPAGISDPGFPVVLPGGAPLPSAAPARGSGWWGRYVQAGDGPAGAPFSEIKIQPGPAVAPVTVAQAENPIKLPDDPIKLPPVPAPTSDPALVPMAGNGKPDVPIPPPAPVVPKDLPTKPVVGIPMPELTPRASVPIQVSPPPVASATEKKDPIRLPPPPPIAPPAGIAGAPLPTSPGGGPTMPLADPVLPSAKKDPGIAAAAKSSIPTTPATPRPQSIGTIGTTGNEVPVAPLQPPQITGRGGAAPVLGVGSAVPALPAAGRALPTVVSHTDEVHPIEPGQTTFAQLSQRWYATEKYADALREYNRRHLLNRDNAGLRDNPPKLALNQPIYYPHPNVLESDFATYMSKTPTASAVPSISRPVVQISPPTPLITTTPAEATVSYRVPTTDWVGNIATRTLGSFDEWRNILRLNPSLRTDLQIPAGTVLRLPANARTN